MVSDKPVFEECAERTALVALFRPGRGALDGILLFLAPEGSERTGRMGDSSGSYQ